MASRATIIHGSDYHGEASRRTPAAYLSLRRNRLLRTNARTGAEEDPQTARASSFRFCAYLDTIWQRLAKARSYRIMHADWFIMNRCSWRVGSGNLRQCCVTCCALGWACCARGAREHLICVSVCLSVCRSVGLWLSVTLSLSWLYRYVKGWLCLIEHYCSPIGFDDAHPRTTAATQFLLQEWEVALTIICLAILA